MKRYNNLVNSEVNKKDIVETSEYFPKRKYLVANVKVELCLSNYATKSDLKTEASVDTPDFAKKNYLTNFKSDVDKLDIDKLKSIASGLNT